MAACVWLAVIRLNLCVFREVQHGIAEKVGVDDDDVHVLKVQYI